MLPALFLSVCNADEFIYEQQDGLKDYEDSQWKRVDENAGLRSDYIYALAWSALHLFSMTKPVTAVSSFDHSRSTLFLR